ncbi:MAG: hypothetical protein IJ759_05760 [Bacteroidales bacterium]|nr:hypothetical protein [Bacteroidales bacterium]
MKRVKLVLLLVLAVILCPKISKAQTASIMTSFRTEREIPNTENFNAIKSMEVGDGRIVSLAHEVGSPNTRPYYVITSGEEVYPSFEHVTASYFMLTFDGANYFRCAYLQDITVTDFDYDKEEDMIYFCGVYKNPNVNAIDNIIGWIDVSTLFNTSTNQITLYKITPPDATSYLKKIDFYRQYTNSSEKRLSLIANNNDDTPTTQGFADHYFPPSQFITYNLTNNSYHVLECPDGIRLTDVVHTDTKVAVVGIQDKTHLVLFSHDQQNVDNYTGQIFETYILYDYATDLKYSIAPLSRDYIVIGSSLIADEGHGRLEFTTFDIHSGINLMHTQAIVNLNNYMECRSKIADMEFDKGSNILHVLAINGCTYIYLKDMILQLRPFDTTTYPSYIVVPDQTVTGYDLMKDLTLYRNNKYYLVFGAMADQQGAYGLEGNLYFFDKAAYDYPFNNSHCERNYNFNIGVVPSKYISSPMQYLTPLDYQTGGSIFLLQHTNKWYQVICND